eukprot:TRINITY_DN3947_c0_g1_i1.p1 TRINITY_DN3947_c0_g1~~TRINITY_DN3947_c0_g1_i1.p1  ORF type:complete len:709 (+),score=123.87 TRINITY_DN3947_c0_g1_i1:136-2262(+)
MSDVSVTRAVADRPSAMDKELMESPPPPPPPDYWTRSPVKDEDHQQLNNNNGFIPQRSLNGASGHQTASSLDFTMVSFVHAVIAATPSQSASWNLHSLDTQVRWLCTADAHMKNGIEFYRALMRLIATSLGYLTVDTDTGIALQHRPSHHHHHIFHPHPHPHSPSLSSSMMFHSLSPHAVLKREPIPSTDSDFEAWRPRNETDTDDRTLHYTQSQHHQHQHPLQQLSQLPSPPATALPTKVLLDERQQPLPQPTVAPVRRRGRPRGSKNKPKKLPSARSSFSSDASSSPLRELCLMAALADEELVVSPRSPVLVHASIPVSTPASVLAPAMPITSLAPRTGITTPERYPASPAETDNEAEADDKRRSLALESRPPPTLVRAGQTTRMKAKRDIDEDDDEQIEQEEHQHGEDQEEEEEDAEEQPTRRRISIKRKKNKKSLDVDEIVVGIDAGAPSRNARKRPRISTDKEDHHDHYHHSDSESDNLHHSTSENEDLSEHEEDEEEEEEDSYEEEYSDGGEYDPRTEKMKKTKKGTTAASAAGARTSKHQQPRRRSSGASKPRRSSKRGSPVPRLSTGRKPQVYFTKLQSQQLRKLVAQHGPDWKLMAEILGNGFTSSNCSQHWARVANPAINKGQYTVDEDQKILRIVAEIGTNSWSAIAKAMGTGRTDTSVRGRYFRLIDQPLGMLPGDELQKRVAKKSPRQPKHPHKH